jgi:hypothetical protein
MNPLTVKTLIELLQRCDQSAEVYVWNDKCQRDAVSEVLQSVSGATVLLETEGRP